MRKILWLVASILIICTIVYGCENSQTVKDTETFTIQNVSLEMPNYWIEEDSVTDVFNFYAEKDSTGFFEYKASCLQIEFPYESDTEYDVSFDGLYADNQNMIEAFGTRYEDANVLKDEVFESDYGVKGMLYQFKFNKNIGLFDEKPAKGYCFCFPSEAERRWYYINLIIVDGADAHQYESDYMKLLKSIRCESGDLVENTDLAEESTSQGNQNDTSENSGYVTDYNDATTFEKALNNGEAVSGRTVRFKVNDYKPDSVLGINCWAGEHLNFISNVELNVKKGDIVVGRVTGEPSKILGSWKIPFEALQIGETKLKEEKQELSENEIKVPVSASTLKNDNYNDVIKVLSNAGFTNIKTNILYDIFWGFTVEGSVESVSISGKKDFLANDVFSKDAEIIITYHMKEADDPSFIKMEKESSDYVGLYYTDVKAKMEELGFTNIVLKQQVTTDIKYSSGEVIGVTIDGKKFSSGSRYKSGSEVLITYYTRKTTLGEMRAIIDGCYGLTATDALKLFNNTDCTIVYIVEGVETETVNPAGLFFYDGKIDRETSTVYLEFTTKDPSKNQEKLEAFLPKQMALRAAVVAMTNSCATDVFKKDGFTYDTSKFHKYSDISGFYLSVYNEGIWIAKNETTWRISGFTCRLSGYTTYLHASMDITYKDKKYVVSNVEKIITSGAVVVAEDLKKFEPEYLEPTKSNPFLTVSPSLVAKDRDAAAEKIQNDKTMPTETRKNWINDQFSSWTGEHKQLQKLIKNKLNDEKSYKHIETTYQDITYKELADSINKLLKKNGYSQRVKVGDLFVACEFSAKNVFNATVKNTAYAVVRFETNTVELIAIE